MPIRVDGSGRDQLGMPGSQPVRATEQDEDLTGVRVRRPAAHVVVVRDPYGDIVVAIAVEVAARECGAELVALVRAARNVRAGERPTLAAGRPQPRGAAVQDLDRAGGGFATDARSRDTDREVAITVGVEVMVKRVQ